MTENPLGHFTAQSGEMMYAFARWVFARGVVGTGLVAGFVTLIHTSAAATKLPMVVTDQQWSVVETDHFALYGHDAPQSIKGMASDLTRLIEIHERTTQGLDRHPLNQRIILFFRNENFFREYNLSGDVFTESPLGYFQPG